VLVTGGFTGDFSSSTMLAVSSRGRPPERAHGFGFSSEIFYDAPRGAALVLDFGVTEIRRSAPTPTATPCATRTCSAPGADREGEAQDRPPAHAARRRHADVQGRDEESRPRRAIDPVANGARILSTTRTAAPSSTSSWRAAYVPSTRDRVDGQRLAHAWNWKSINGEAGITSVKVRTKPSVPGLVKFSVKGSTARFDTSGAALPVQGVFALGAAGQGGLATFPGPAPSPSCAIVSGGNTLNCK
jgi:hypothetical protein